MRSDGLQAKDDRGIDLGIGGANIGAIYYKCPDCGCWRKFGEPTTLNEQGEARILKHVRENGAIIDDKSWKCPRCRVKINKKEA